MLRGFIGAAACMLLVGCSTNPSDLQSKTEPFTKIYPENYQEIFRRISSQAKICTASVTGFTTAAASVDSQLYPDLGYGEISISMDNWSVKNYYWTAKIEKDGQGSRVIMNAGNSLAAGDYLRRAQAWAGGSTNCN